MGRTDKGGIRRSKEAQAKSKRAKGLNMQPFYKSISKKTLEQKKEDGDIIQFTNPLGKTYFWYRKGRKTCLDTGFKVDPDGYDKTGFKSLAGYAYREISKNKRK